MSDGIYGGAGTFSGGKFDDLLAKYIGETVTIFTGSGGQSGSGFTGVILAVNECFVRLITRMGPAPGCALGNSCMDFNTGNVGYNDYKGYGGYTGYGAPAAGGWKGNALNTVGAVTDIPIASIVSFVHNAV